MTDMRQGHVIEISKARQHNLQGIDIQIPVGKITVITGISGSGKSTLAMDVLFAEGQYRYLQSLSQDMWASVKLWDRPDVESISNLPPPVALEQKRPHGNHRSTVATLTGTKSLLRMLFATAGTARCPSCRKHLKASTIDQIVDRLLQLGEGTKLVLLSPVTHLFQSMPIDKAVETVGEQGFLRVMVNGQLVYTDQPVEQHEPIDEALIVIDRLVIKPGIIGRLTDSAQLALRAGNGMLIAEVIQKDSGLPKHLLTFTERPICKQCHRSFPDIEPAFFSMIEQCTDQQLEKILPPHMSAAEFREFIRCVELGGVTWDQIFKMTLHDLLCWIRTVQTSMSETDSCSMAGHRVVAAERLLRAIRHRIIPAVQMNLDYLTLERQTSTLSTGEVQRIRIGEQLARNMSGILYIMDEPTTGLHPAEHQAVWQQIEKLCASGNTVLIIEHDTNFMQRAHHIVELGPGAGDQGGRVIFSGTPQEIMDTDRDTASGPWLSGEKALDRDRLTPGGQGWISLGGLKANNLKDVAIKIPVACLTSLVGPSGSGKSSLAQDIAKQLSDNTKAGRSDGYGQGNEGVARVLIMDQSAISGSATSMPATWMGVFGSIRRLFARTIEARKRGITAGWFSLAKKGGRCEHCRGRGILTTDLKFLPPVQSRCDVCGGTRYSRDALSVTYKGKTISEVLEMTVNQAANFFSNITAIRKPLEWIERAGLGYLKLGQPTNTLSGGEAQRLKLAKELAKSNQQKTMYILDEPTMGLHLEDVENILEIFNDLLELGHTVMIAEHDPRLIAVSDWVIELGPIGGPDGGRITFQGTPKEMIKAEKSVTGRFLQGLVPNATLQET